MKILVTGSSGLVGSAVVESLDSAGHEVIRLVRSAPKSRTEVQWNPETGDLDAKTLEGIDAVVHLAGESIASGRWNEQKKARIRDSRILGTLLLAETLAKLSRPPRVLVSASAIGYYGDRGDELLDESSLPGKGFLADVCVEWERALDPAIEKGVRVVILRIGVILSAVGGALARMIGPFKFGAGGRAGSGRQYMSWIALDDVVGAISYSLAVDSLRGAVNVVAPNAVTNDRFTKALGHVLSRPAFFPLPAFAARLALGEMADELLLASTRVEPRKLFESGYVFKHANIEEALRHVLRIKQR